MTRAEAPPAARSGHVGVKPATARLIGGRARLAAGSEERIDQIIYPTGYRISLPSQPPSLLRRLRRRAGRATPGGGGAGRVDRRRAHRAAACARTARIATRMRRKER
jgi:hypothetical protein